MHSTQKSQQAPAMQAALDGAKAKGARAAKVRCTLALSEGCEFEAGRLKTVETSRDRNAQVTVVLDGRLGQASATRLEDLTEAVDRALALARVGQEIHFQGYPDPAGHRPVRLYSDATAALDREDLVAEASDVVEAIRQYDADLHIIAGAGKEVRDEHLMTTSGVDYQSKRTRWYLYGHAQRTGEDDVLFCAASRHGLDLGGAFGASRVHEPLLDDLRRCEDLAQPPRGEMPILFAPRVVASLIQVIGMGLSGRRVAKGESPLENRFGQQIAHESFSLVDDPLTDFANGAAEVDDCGVPARKMTLIDRGRLCRFLYDWDSAHLAGAEPTGHPGCALHSPVLPAGKHTQTEMVSALSNGVFVRSLGGFGQGNVINGDFAANVALGWRIENGRWAGRVKNTMISGNLYEILRRPVVFSRDVDEVYRMPTALLEGVTVSARG